MKKLFLKSLFLLCALVVGSLDGWATDYEKYTSSITEGDYVIVYDNGAMTNTVSSDRLSITDVQPSNNKISNPASSIIWHIAASGNYWTIYNATVGKYAASTGAKNKAQLLSSGTDDMSLWTVSGLETYDFVNKKNTANSVNAHLRLNGNYGFACYASGTAGNLTLYKKVESTGEATTVTIDASGITNTNKFVSTDAGSLVATVKAGETPLGEASVTWSSGTETVATINATTGAVTLVGEGTTIITASYAGNASYKSSSNTYELTVTNENPAAVEIWSEDFSGFNNSDVPSGGTYNYSCTNGTKTSGSTSGGTTKVDAANVAGGTSPELMVGKKGSGDGALGGSFTATIPLRTSTYCYSGDITLYYKTNANELNVKTTTDGLTVEGEASTGAGLSFNTAATHKITFKGITTSTENITIVFTATTTNNVRVDDIVLKGAREALTKVATPIISPASGAVASGTKVTITSLTDGAMIY